MSRGSTISAGAAEQTTLPVLSAQASVSTQSAPSTGIPTSGQVGGTVPAGPITRPGWPRSSRFASTSLPASSASGGANLTGRAAPLASNHVGTLRGASTSGHDAVSQARAELQMRELLVGVFVRPEVREVMETYARLHPEMLANLLPFRLPSFRRMVMSSLGEALFKYRIMILSDLTPETVQSFVDYAEDLGRHGVSLSWLLDRLTMFQHFLALPELSSFVEADMERDNIGRQIDALETQIAQLKADLRRVDEAREKAREDLIAAHGADMTKLMLGGVGNEEGIDEEIPSEGLVAGINVGNMVPSASTAGDALNADKSSTSVASLSRCDGVGSKEVGAAGSAMLDQESPIVSIPSLSEAAVGREGEGTESTTNGLLSPSASGSKDKLLLEPNKAKNTWAMGGSRLDRRGSGMGDDDKWNKMPGPLASGRDMRLDMGHGGNVVGSRLGQGGNYGVLRDPRTQTYVQYAGGILSGRMHSPGSQGGMQRNSADSDRWQRATGFQKGLIPSSHTPLQVMHKAEREYEIGKVTDEEQAKQRQLKDILNKLTPQNFEELFEQVKQLNIDNAGTLAVVISQIFDKALMEPTFCEMYANFCCHLAEELPDFNDDNEKITFRRLLVNKCQEEFQRGEREQEEANRNDEEGEAKQSEEEREEKRIQARRRMLFNIRLIGGLYKKKMLTERIMHECIKKLLGEYQNPDEEDVEALCKLMSSIGEVIDHPKAKEHMDVYFDIMAKLSNNMELSSRVRFMLKDVIDLRKNKWQQKDLIPSPDTPLFLRKNMWQQRRKRDQNSCEYQVLKL